ncbi:hypothetical protein A7985_25040 [Pseudoalteromonas luteoviolacea]|uniref:Uncharacterized protein n=1 Tax=Pseudoalteromonas luteoviolacea TaxID=43657 RepID=A0A1C0TIR9_9GAMM|nr:hypothetical protein [Pseudoalteromonas luteoviolacea]OCQ17945.1 hypothetical protein A7985_25040 [Pseudoalteromonas luteoviolacea]
MGTSASASGPNNQSPLVPPWAEEGNSVQFGTGDGAYGEQDGTGSGEQGDDQSSNSDSNQETDNSKVQEKIPGSKHNEATPNRLVGARTSFGEYAKGGGGSSNLRSSLRKYAKGSGGGSGTSRRLASGITAGTSLFRMMSGDSVKANYESLSISDLNGLSTDQAIDRITEHLTPENGDADAVRVALDYALAEALPDVEDFDESVFTEEVMHETLSCFLTDLIFQDIVTGMGEAWFHTEHASKHHRMEEELRELVKVVTQQQVESITHGNAGNITKDNIDEVQIAVITQTVEVWESYND